MPNRLFWTQTNRAFSRDNVLVPGAHAYFYKNRLAVQLPVYQDPGCEQEFSQPVVANSEGTFPPIYIADFTPFRVRMTDADDVTLPGYPLDDLVPLSADLSTAANVTFTPSEAVQEENVQSAIEAVAAQVAGVGGLQMRALTIWDTAGSGNAYTIAPTPEIVAYGDWQYFTVKFDRANSGSATLNVNELGPRSIRKVDATGAVVALADGDLSQGMRAGLFFDGSQFILDHGGPIEGTPIGLNDPRHARFMRAQANSFRALAGGPSDNLGYAFDGMSGTGLHFFTGSSTLALMYEAKRLVEMSGSFTAFYPGGDDAEAGRFFSGNEPGKRGLGVGSIAPIDFENPTSFGVSIASDGAVKVRRNIDVPLWVGRYDSGTLVRFYRREMLEVTIAVDGLGVVTYNTFCGAHWSMGIGEQIPGTIVETIDELCVWSGVVSMLPKVRLATPESRAVYGVFSSLDEDGDVHVAGLGAYRIRIAPGHSVKRGDLIVSAGGGLGKPQGDDVIRASTVGKVTSSIVLETLPDGSFCVPCVIYCG